MPGKKILIVDDSAELRELIKHILRDESYEIAEASNGREAIEYLLKNPLPEVILLDSVMEVMSGPAFIEELEKTHPRLLEQLKIIVLSGSDRFIHAKIDVSMRKPVDFGILVQTIAKIISEKPDGIRRAQG